MTSETDIREELAPRVAAMILNRQGPHGLTATEAEQLAHQILAMAGAAFLRMQGDVPPGGEAL